ncbi:MAG: translation initiation factor IF-2 subunit alpha [Conexivisphaerales archaeon]
MSQQLPDEGEILIATVKQITPFGAYVSLDEYAGRNAFLHISEISTGWVRNIERYIKVNQKVVLKVIRIDKDRDEVDCSLRQVTNEEKRQKLIQVKKEAKAKGVLEIVKKASNLRDDSDIKLKLQDEYGSLYDALAAIAKKGEQAVAKLGLDKGYVDNLVKVVAERFKLPGVEVKGMFEMTCSRADGVDVIKGILQKATEQVSDGSSVEITYAGAPRYLVKLRADNFKLAERNLKILTEYVTKQMSKVGTVNFVREKS